MPGSLFDDGSLDQYTDAQSNPAAPAGMGQAGQAAVGVATQQPGYENSSLGQSLLDGGFTEMAPSWYTGRNLDDVENGWDNSFVQKFMDGQDEAAKQGTLSTYFSQPDATGVVTWDHLSEDGRHQLKFGDVFENGKKVANVYDQFDRDTANLMMSDFVLDADEKAHVYADGERITDPNAPLKLPGLDEAVKEKRDANNIEIPQTLAANEFNSDVLERADAFREGNVDEAIVGGGAVGGGLLGGGLAAAATAAPFGAELGPLGVAAAGATGFVVGGVGAYLNKDALTEQAARAYEITSMSMREHNDLAGYATGVSQWAGFGSKLISPLSNLTQGLYDVKEGEVGDGQAEFYAVDDEGQRKAGNWVKVTDVAATVGDSFLQFASPTGLALYSAQMGGTIGGEVGELVFSGGDQFDYQRAGFDNIFTDDNGNFDPLSGAAGIGKIGIDAVQMGMARGLAGKANAERVALGEDAGYRGMLAGRSGEQVGGSKFVLDDAGTAVERKWTTSLMAPSEQLHAASSAMMARRAAKLDGGRAVTVDDYYRASLALAHGEKKVNTILVNAMGEGYEEGVQGVLEPMSHNQDVNWREVGTAAMYGFAAGTGMGLGIGRNGVSADDKMWSQAKLARETMSGGAETISKAQWAAMDEVQKRTAASLDNMLRETAFTALRKIEADQAIETVGGAPAAHKLWDAVQSWWSQGQDNVMQRTDGAFVITQIEDAGEVDATGALKFGTIPSDAVASSGLQLLQNLLNHQKGIAEQRAQLEKNLATFTDRIDAALDPAEVDLQRAQLEAQLKRTEDVLLWSTQLNDELDALVKDMYDPATATVASIEADAEVINVLLRDVFHRRLDSFGGEALTDDQKLSLAMAVSTIFARDPHDSAGSYQPLVPQVSARLTAANAQNVLEISHAILPSIRGDFDGDKLRPLNTLILDEKEFTSARAGAYFVGTGASVNIKAPKYEKYQVEYLAQALRSDNTTLQAFAVGTRTQIADTIRQRYEGVVGGAVLDRVLTRFFDKLEAGDPDSRNALIDGLATEAGGQITDFARTNLSNEWLWVDQVIKSNLNWFQSVFAEHGTSRKVNVNTETGRAVPQSTNINLRRAEEAATAGITLGLWTDGESMFRKFQKLHYSSVLSPVLSADNSQADMSLQDMILLYEGLNSQVTEAEIDAIRAKDRITARVFLQLDKLARDAEKAESETGGRLTRSQALAVVANMAVRDYTVGKDGIPVESKSTITLTQMLLKRELERDRREKDAIWAISPELRAKHAKLANMVRPNSSRGESKGAEKAFIEVIGAQQFYTLLGEESEVFGPHLTPEQWIRQYAGKSDAQRFEESQRIRLQPEYLGRKDHAKDMPYNFSEVEHDQISAYRSVVDALLAVGNGLHAERQERSERVSTDWQQAHTTLRQSLREMIGGRRDGEFVVDQIRRMMETNPDVARRFFDLIPNNIAHLVLEYRDDQVYVANWFYETLAIKDSKHAEMHYWRNLLLAEVHAYGIDQQIREDVDDREAKISYAKMTRRMHRLIVDLSRMPDGGITMSKFLERMEQSTDLEEFMRWVNTHPGIKGRQAPFTAWVDDTAEFDADKAQGGWTTALQGAELREAIRALRDSSERLNKDMLDERSTWVTDQQVLSAVRRVEQGSPDVTPLDRETHARFSKAIEMAGKRQMGLGPAAMIYQSIGAVLGMYSQAHTKGKNPANVELIGQFDALRDAYGYVTNFERLMGSLTSLNISAVSQNPSELAKGEVRAMDEFGREVTWTGPSVMEMVGLFENADTRALARSIIFPQVMERTMDGRLSTQMLVGKSLKALTSDNNLYNESLFPVNDTLSNDHALRYASMVEATARQYGGHFSLQRVVNDLVIARTSGARRVLGIYDIEQMVTQAYRDVVQVLQTSGELAARTMSSDEDLLAPVRDLVRDAQRTARANARIGRTGAADEGTLEEFLDGQIRDLEREALEDANPHIAAGDPDTAQKIFDARDRAIEKINLLRDNNAVEQVQAMFSWPADQDPTADQKQAVAEYVLDKLSLLGQTQAVKIEMAKLTQHVLDRGNHTLPEHVDWRMLSRAAMARYIDDMIGVPSGSAIPLFPDNDDVRYYDTSFAYVVEPLLDRNHPLVQAAKDLHMQSGRELYSTDVDLMALLDRTVLDNGKFGTWTSDIPRASIEANQRLDSAAAAPALSVFGNEPKTQGVISAATKRTYRVPPAEMLSTTTLTMSNLRAENPLNYTVDTVLPDGRTVVHPLAMLNNRFAASITLTIDGEDFDLLDSDEAVGRVFAAEPTAASSGYVEITVDRIYEALDRRGLENAVVTIKYFHPDSLPSVSTEENSWRNNLFFEGTSFKLDADRHSSLNSTLWFAFGSISPDGQATALDASKLGQPAMKVIPGFSAEDRKNVEADWSTDLATVLRRKTAMLMDTDLGFGKLDIEFFNAVYKNFKIRHYARLTSGEVWSADQVIAYQNAPRVDGEANFLEGATLWVPSDDVLRDMLGDQMFQGVGRLLDLDLEFDLAKTPEFIGVRPEMLAAFKGMQTGAVVGIGDTSAAARTRQGTLKVRTQLPAAEREVWEKQRLHFDQLQGEIFEARSTMMARGEHWQFDPSRNLRDTVFAEGDMLAIENLAMNWAAAGVPWVGPRNPSDPFAQALVLRDVARVLDSDEFRTGWLYKHVGPPNPAAGVLTQVSLNNTKEKAFQVAPGDLVAIDVSTFEGDQDAAIKLVDYMIGRGAIIALGSTDGATDVTAAISRHLLSKNYESIVGTKRVYMQSPLGSRFQTPRSRYSTFLEVEAISPRDVLTILNVRDQHLEENAAWVVSTDNLADVRVSVDLVPTSFLGQFNVPVGALTNTTQMTQVRTRLRDLDTPQGRKALKDQVNSKLKGDARKKADKDFDLAYDEMMARFNRTSDSVLPNEGDEFGQGAMLPLVDMAGNIVLYRHGFKPPSLDELSGIFSQAVDGFGPIKVAAYTSDVEPSATVRTGRVAQFTPRSGYGLQVELHTPLQEYGDKKQLELNGMKFLLTPKPDSFKMPPFGIFANRGVDLIASTSDMVSKEAFRGTADNHRNAFAYFGIDFIEDVTRFFFPGEDARSPAAQQKALTLLQAVEQHTERIPVEAAHEVLSGHLIGAAVTNVLPQLRDLNPGVNEDWLDNLNNGSVEAQVTAALIVYLMVPGARIDHVLSTGGFNDATNTDGAKKSRLMPRLFTQVFDNAPLGSDLRKEINRRLNTQIANKVGGEGYILHENFQLEIRTKTETGYSSVYADLQFAEAHSSGDNPITNGQAFDNSTQQGISQHSASVAFQAIGALTPEGRGLDKVKAQLKGIGRTKFRSEGAETPGAEAWAMITGRMRRVAGGHSLWNRETPAEEERRAFASDEVGHYRKAILTNDPNTWSDRERTEYDQAAIALVESLGLLAEQKGLVDYWVRQWLGRADGVDSESNPVGYVVGRDAVEAAREMLEVVSMGHLPTTSAMVPLMHVNDLQLIFRANRHSSSPWSPKTSLESTERASMNWDDWVLTALGSAILSDAVFDPFFLLATDGMMHSYQNATDALTDLPVSLDALVARAALDPEVNETVMALSQRDAQGNRMRVSLEPNTDRLASETVVLDTMHASIEDVIGGKRVAGRVIRDAAPASAIARRRASLRRHRKENGIPMPVDRGMKNFRKNGLEFGDASTNANAFIRSLILLRVGTATLNPALWLSMGPEQWVRGTLDRLANVATGTSTAGRTAEMLAEHGWSFYTPEQVQKLDTLYEQLGSRNDFKSMIYRDLAFLRPHGDSIGKVEKVLEKYASAGTRMQDATYGLRAKTLSRRYIEGALAHINATPTLNVLTVDRLIAEMTVNPEFLQRNYPEAHRAASNAVAQIRSLKQTTSSVLLKGMINPLAESENLAINMTGNLLFKIPLIFSGYLLNVVTTITGMQGADQFLATWMNVRKKGRLGEIQAGIRGKTEEGDEYTDLDQVIESIDLSRAFIRGGITHTGLFTLAMAAGGMGLGGEDDETKKRRRLAKAQGAGFVFDPRSVVNDFRNADAIYFDWLPSLGPVDLNWTLRQFISPIIGIQKAIETGDTRHITWGFEDAIGSFPLINTMMWRDVVETGEQLKAQALEEEAAGNTAAAAGLMTNFVGVYERMLFESSFVNQIYVGADRWDRNPYALPLLDSDGDLQVDAEGNTRANDRALGDYIDPETGERKVGFMTRDDMSAQLHSFTESRATMATVLSIFSGGGFGSDFIRYNMPVKERVIELQPETQDDVESVIIAAYLAANEGKPIQSVTEKELEDGIRQALFKQKGYYAPDSEVMPIARRMAADSGIGALSVINEEGREEATTAGVKVIVRDLGLGRIKLDDPALLGFHVTYEQRVAIQKEWQEAIIQEGVDLGLDQSKAVDRMTRIWTGPYDDPTVQGIGDILWLKPEQGGLSYSDKAVYKQLNTTYVVGPNGQPYSTGFGRSQGVFGAVLNALGAQPLHTMLPPGSDAMGRDDRFNSTDLVNRVNTGLRGLVLKNDTENVPTDKEIADEIIKAIKESAGKDYTPFAGFPSSSSGGGGGWGGWSSFGGGGYGGGGGGSYAPRVYFQEMRDLGDIRTPYGNTIRSVNADNPIIRRSDVRRERVWSERGRLKQWQ